MIIRNRPSCGCWSGSWSKDWSGHWSWSGSRLSKSWSLSKYWGAFVTKDWFFSVSWWDGPSLGSGSFVGTRSRAWSDVQWSPARA